MTETRDIMTRLKEDTRPLHEAAENQPYMHALMSGRLSKEHYLAALEQFYVLHVGVEERLRELLRKSRFAGAVVKDHHFRIAELAKQDLEFFGKSTEGIKPVPGVVHFFEAADGYLAKNPDAYLGMFYVLEGSLNGAMFLVKKVRETFKIEGDNGVSHMVPHGQAMRQRWMEFVMGMNQLPFPEETKDDIVAAAGDAFNAVGELYRNVTG